MFVAVIACVILIIFFKSPLLHRPVYRLFRDFKATITAKGLDRFQVIYNDRMKHRKRVLIRNGLERLQVQLKTNDSSRRLKILEIGAGTGANFEFFPPEVDVTCVEPNRKSEILLRRNAQRFPDVRVDKFLVMRAENMLDSVEKESVDAIISTLVLCSVDDVEKCLHHVFKILKPGGQFFFMEHVRADHGSSRKTCMLQKFMKTPWRLLLECDVTRTTQDIIRKTPFSRVDIEQFDAVELLKPTTIFPMVEIMSPHIMGVATK